MSEANAAGLPSWVCKRNGRLEPFDADQITQALFAATEALGAPNALLARELSDAVVHFLVADTTDTPPTTAQIADHVVKVVRELGQPALAQAFAQAVEQPPRADATPTLPRRAITFEFSPDDAPESVARGCLRALAERVVFSRDLISAQEAGLLRLAGLETPRALARCLLDTFHATPGGGTASYWVALPNLCEVAGQGVVLDGIEWRTTGADTTLLCEIAMEWLVRLFGVARRHVIVNLNTAEPPAWARRRDLGPLFAAESSSHDPAAGALLDALLLAVPPSDLRYMRWDWHLQARDFAAGPHRERLHRVAEHALGGSPVAFVFDRARRPVSLAEGMDRSQPAVLLEVGLDVEALLRSPRVGSNADAFFEKLPSLVRMAVSAGAQKRKYLRRQGEGTPLTRGFLLDRARLVVVPLGLDAVVRLLAGTGATALDLARQIVKRLHDDARAAGRDAHLEVAIDSPGPGLTELLSPRSLSSAGPTLADPLAPPGEQLRAAGMVHVVTGQGTARVHLPPGAAPTPDELVELLDFAWRRTDVVRVIFVPAA